MKIYNSFNEMFNAQSSTKSDLSVFNVSKYIKGSTQQEIEADIKSVYCQAVYEWVDTLSNDERLEFMVRGWDFFEFNSTGADDIWETPTMKAVVEDIKQNPEEVFTKLKDMPHVSSMFHDGGFWDNLKPYSLTKFNDEPLEAFDAAYEAFYLTLTENMYDADVVKSVAKELKDGYWDEIYSKTQDKYQ